MAAPTKAGLDYFPFYTTLIRDRKLRPAKLKYGYLATMVYICLLCIIYDDHGYYCDCRDEENLIWDIMEMLHGKYQPEAETVKGVIEILVACELFSGDLYRSKILTSKRIQDIYYRSTLKRTGLTVNRKIWLLSEEEMRAISTHSSILSFLVNDGNNGVNDVNNSVNDANNEQIKENKIKEKKTKENSFPSDSFQMEAARRLRDGTLRLFPKQKVPDDKGLNKWAEIIDKMIRLDKRSENDILDVLDFALKDDFWKQNIRSADKLRKQFDNLYVKMVSGRRGQKNEQKNDIRKSQTEEYFRQLEQEMEAGR